jgi:dynein heavy chain
MKTATMQLRMYLDEQQGIPYETLRNVVGDISYGGRVTDKWDKRTNLSLLSRYFTPEILAEGAEPYMFAESNTYYAPSAPTRADVRKYIEGLPLDETPDVFGLHENASITLQMKETGELLGTLVSMQPRAGGGGDSGGPSNDDVVLEMVDSILSRLPPPMDAGTAHPTSFATDEAGNVNSLGVFLEQEMERFNELGSVLRRTLGQLKKAVKGLVVMSASLENMYNCFLFQKVPPEWEGAAYPSLKPLGYWVESLYQRLDTLRGWLTGGPPTAYWISGFFFPQGFMTGALQMYARRTKIAIDALEFRTVVQPFYAGAVPAAPAHGVYIYGLFLAGSRWDVATGQLAEMEAGKLLSPLPCLWLEPALNKDINTGTAYVCPVYKTSRRAGTLSTTGHSTNFITTVFLPTSKSQDHWVRRGCALLSEDENNA